MGAIGDSTSGHGITVEGSGTLALAAANTSTGPTNVNSGTLLIQATGSMKSTAFMVGRGGTLQLAGTTNALPAAANFTTQGTGIATDGAVSLTGTATESIGTLSSVGTRNGDSATVYAGNTTVGDGTNAASLTATQILQNTLTINANSTVTIAPSGAGGGVVAAASSASAASSTASADSSGDCDRPPKNWRGQDRSPGSRDTFEKPPIF